MKGKMKENLDFEKNNNGDSRKMVVIFPLASKIFGRKSSSEFQKKKNDVEMFFWVFSFCGFPIKNSTPKINHMSHPCPSVCESQPPVNVVPPKGLKKLRGKMMGKTEWFSIIFVFRHFVETVPPIPPPGPGLRLPKNNIPPCHTQERKSSMA